MMQVFEPHLVGVSQRNTWVTSVGATNSHDAANSESYVTKIVRTDPMPVVEQEVLCESGLLRPRTNRSLNSAGWYRPSLSPIKVSVMTHRSSKRYQSALLRASRETSSPRMIPTRPRATSEAIRVNPPRLATLAPDTPRSSSITITCSLGQPRSHARWANAYCRAVDSR